MEELTLSDHFTDESIFLLFKIQLKKDFEGAGLEGDFVDGLRADLQLLKQALISQVSTIGRRNPSGLMALLYRVDISQEQINARQSKSDAENFDELLAELIIKRVLQKVILKKTFSK